MKKASTTYTAECNGISNSCDVQTLNNDPQKPYSIDLVTEYLATPEGGMTNDNTPSGWSVTWSSGYAYPQSSIRTGYAAFIPTSVNQNREWISETTDKNPWVVIQFPKAVAITRFTAGCHNTDSNVHDMILQGSDNGSDFDSHNIQTYTNINLGQYTFGNVGTFNVDNTQTKYRYYRFKITRFGGRGLGLASLNGVQMWGK